MRCSQILVFLAVVFAAPLFAQDAPSVPCQPCQGKARVTAPCMACEGTRKVNCSDCSKHSVHKSQVRGWRIDLYAEGKNSVEELGKHLSELSYLSTSSKQLSSVMGGKDGFLTCPSCAILLGTHKNCKACKKKGRVRCPACKGKGLGKCAGCSGKGDIQRQCIPCMGTSQEEAFPTLTEGTPPECGWCQGTHLIPCTTCILNQEKPFTCHDCQGRKKKICGKCSGKKKMSCRSCLGRGISLTPSPYPGKERCKTCKGKKTAPCTSCKGGKNTCQTCNGKGKAPRKCPDCLGKSKTLCLGCADGRTWYWEAGAQYWKSQSNEQQMNLYLDMATANKTAYMDKFLEACEIAATLLDELATSEKAQPKSPYSPFKDLSRARSKWLEDYKVNQHRELRSGLTRLRKLRNPD
ncbi:MAG: hypothetical protein P1V35_04120 [Planctomycetota bacterium]|nr:hypothetical protein [Planctomycetota bacterium]